MRTLLAISSVAALAACAHTQAPGPTSAASTVPPVGATAPAAGTTTPSSTPSLPTGDLHDFDTFAGGWTFQNRRLKARGVGSNDWDTFPAVSCTNLHIDSVANVDEIYFPTKGWSGLTVRTFDTAKHQWSIYWVSSKTGVMFPPVVGGFQGNTGDFYGDDTDDGKPVKVRFHWIKYSADHLKWEQWFSYDGGTTWEMNWTNELTRGDEAKICDHGRPRR
jgi:hypothetical protein